MNASEILAELKEGNRRFLSNKRIFPRQSLEYVQELAEKGQSPMATVVCCSDSRVNPIIFFDQGLGDFFIVRCAGNVLGKSAMESIAYAVDTLSVPLVLMLGHTQCGAVQMAVDNYHNHTLDSTIAEKIKPAIDQSQNQDGDLCHNVSRNNIRNMAKLLGSTKFINPAVIVGAMYNTKTGEVEFYS